MGDYSARTPVKLSSVVNAQRYVPSTTNTSLIVGVRVRPVLKTEQTKAGRKDIIRVIDGKVVVVLDPDESKDYLDQVQHRTKERRYTFDVAFDFNSTNAEVYDCTLRDLVSAVLYGINTTVFAYGATGSGKTYTMVGTPGDPGLMILSLKQVFQDRDRLFVDEEFSVTCTYLEVYNETIYDLLVKNSGPLELREDPEQGVQVAGLKHVPVSTPDDILGLLEDGNKRRKTEATDANMQSSRSHAVLEICVKRKPANHYRAQQLRAKLSLVDLAGSERAAETNNAGQKLRDGASINRSLLALANCINALGKMASAPHRAGATYVPYRNSKLTRLLKDGLSGNSRTAMITTVAAANDQYHHSINTLKYADRAKEIKTHVVQNVGTVESHIADYQRMIDALQVEVSDLRNQLIERQATPAALPTPNGSSSSNGRMHEEDFLMRIDSLVQDMSENIEERINLQKAVFEIEDANLFNRYELKQLEDFLNSGHGSVKDIAEARDRKSDIQTAVRDNERELAKYKAEIQSNESVRTEIQGKIDRLVSHNNNNAAFLNLMRTFRLQAIRLQELKFQMAVRDQIIHEQRAVIGNLWKIINRSGMGQARVLEIARQEGIIMDGLGTWPMDDRPNTAQSDTASYISVINGEEIDVDGHALSGLIAANDQHSATPAATLVGNRAKMRYRFWSHYPPEKGDSDALEFGRQQGGRRGGLGYGTTARRKANANRMGAGIRVEQILHPHHHIAVAGRRAGRSTAGDSSPSGATNSGSAGARSNVTGARSSITGGLNRRLTDEGSGSGRERDGSARRVTDTENAPTGSVSRIHSGRRAGLPVPRPSMRSRVPEQQQVSFQASSATPTPAIPALRPPGVAARRHYRSSSHIDFTQEPQSEPVPIQGKRPSHGGRLRDAQPPPPSKPSMQAWSDEPQPELTPRPPAKMPLSERLARLKGRVANNYGNNYGNGNTPGYASKLDMDQQSHASHASPEPKSHPIMTSQFNAQAEETPPGTSSSAPDALDHHARLQQVLQMNRRLSSAEQARRGAAVPIS